MELLDVYNEQHQRAGRTIARNGEVLEGERLLVVDAYVAEDHLRGVAKLVHQHGKAHRLPRVHEHVAGLAYWQRRGDVSVRDAAFDLPLRLLRKLIAVLAEFGAVAGGASAEMTVPLTAGVIGKHAVYFEFVSEDAGEAYTFDRFTFD